MIKGKDIIVFTIISTLTVTYVNAISPYSVIENTEQEKINILKEKNISVKEIEEDKIDKIIEELLNSTLSLKQNYIFNSIPKYIVLTKRLKKVIIR